MKLNQSIDIDIEDAKKLARTYYNVGPEVPVNVAGMVPANTENVADYAFYSLKNRHIAQSNKIALIKFMRQIICDSRDGVSTADGSLAGAKAYVERYFNC